MTGEPLNSLGASSSPAPAEGLGSGTVVLNLKAVNAPATQPGPSASHRIGKRLRTTLRSDSEFWRKALQAGVQHGPEAWVRYSPPVFGVLFGAALPRQRRAVLRTLRRILGRRPAHEELRDVAEVFSNFASSMTDGMLLGTGRGFVATNRPVADWHFLKCLAQGRGLVIATAQTAGWDLGGPMISSLRGADVAVVMERERDPAARALHDAARQRSGVRVVHVGDDPLASLPLLRHLRQRRGVVAMKFDRIHPGMRSREVRFLGGPWLIPEGPLLLAATAGAPIIPVFTRRLGFMEYQTINTEPIELVRRPSAQQLDAAAQEMASRLERFVRAYPTQWFRFEE
jgi:KDO2-lipid IV(A) lauroyltransferase